MWGEYRTGIRTIPYCERCNLHAMVGTERRRFGLCWQGTRKIESDHSNRLLTKAEKGVS